MKKIKAFFLSIFKLPVYFYRWCISPLLPHACRFSPTCSSYMLDAIDQFGFKGIFLGLKRICRCHPFQKKCGYDPLPANIKGDAKWLF